MARTIISVLTGQKDTASGAGMSTDPPDEEAATTAARVIAAERSVMTLGKMLTFKGELSADEDMVLLGRVEGTITHTQSLTIGVGGSVVGDLRARVITIRGTVDGDLIASESITVAPTANVTGDLTAPHISIIEGAMLNGSVHMSRAAVPEMSSVAPRTDSPAPAPAGEVP